MGSNTNRPKSDDMADIMEAEAMAELLETLGGDEEALIGAYLAAKAAEAAQYGPPLPNCGVIPQELPPKRAEYIPRPAPQNVTPAAQKVLWAARIRTEAEANALAGPDLALTASVRTTERMEAEATQPMPLDHYRVGAGGEIVPDGTGHQLPAPWRDTIVTASLITAEASRSRLDLANDCGVLAQSLDLCETIGATNSIERNIASQMALAHKISMRSGQRADESFERAGSAIDKKAREAHSIQGQRETNSTDKGNGRLPEWSPSASETAVRREAKHHRHAHTEHSGQ